MAERRLRIAEDADSAALPLDVVTQSIGIIARRGAGKTYTAAVLAEELVGAGLPVVVLDPLGAFWGLRSSADGEKAGLPVAILGGDHGDVPLESTAGKDVAEFVVESPGAYVLDLSAFESNAAQDRFVTDFAERLYRLKNTHRDPLHLIVDEADSFAPQRAGPGQLRMLGAFEAIVRRGRIRGLGVTLITQRPAVLNKNVLTQIEVLVTLQLTGPQDRAAVDEWVKANATPEQREAFLGSLASLQQGQAWIWSPSWLQLFARVQIRRRRTFDSSRTPEPGEVVAPKRMAPVDLELLKARMAASIEKADASDPKKLRAQIASLQEANRKWEDIANRAHAEAPVRIERVEVPVLNGQIPELWAAISELRAAAEPLHTAWVSVVGAVDAVTAAIDRVAHSDATVGRVAQAPRAVLARPAGDRAQTAVATPPAAARPQPAPIHADSRPLGKGERTILVAVAQYPAGAARDQLTVLTGYKRSTRDTYLQRLTSAGYVEAPAGGAVRATEAGITALGSDYEPLPEGVHLQAYWRERLPEGERRVLDVLVAAYPQAVRREQIDEETGYKRSSRDTYLQRLRSRRLVENVGPSEVRASEDLFS